MKNKRIISLLVFLLKTSNASAIDTTEPFNVGFSNVEAYFDSGKIARETEDEFSSLQLIIGGGLTERISLFSSSIVPIDAEFQKCSKTLSFGLLWNFLDTEHFDADIQLEGGLDGANVNVPFLAPMLELNLDFNGAGLFMQTIVALSREESPSDIHTLEYICSSGIAMGAYLNAHKDGQLFIQLFSLFPVEENESSARPENISVGYNMAISNFVELITEGRMHFPHVGNESNDFSFLTGFIFTLK
ncbi:MAG: hypothetical protein Kow0090_09150 [Myxococcota bacterium]